MERNKKDSIKKTLMGKTMYTSRSPTIRIREDVAERRNKHNDSCKDNVRGVFMLRIDSTTQFQSKRPHYAALHWPLSAKTWRPHRASSLFTCRGRDAWMSAAMATAAADI